MPEVKLKIFLDETGHTGENLLNKAQPIFVLASNNFESAEIGAILGDFFGTIKADELKHSSLARKSSGQERIALLIEYLQKNCQGRAISVAGHKEYIATAMMVEWLIEPAMSKCGYNLYAQGANIGLANLIFLGLPVCTSPSIKEGILDRFEKLMRIRSSKCFDNFWDYVNGIYRHFPDSHVILDFLMPSQKILSLQDIIKYPKGIMEIGLTMAYNSIGFWSSKTPASLEIIHDNSSSMARVQWLWDQIVSPDVEERNFYYSGINWQFPLKVSYTEFADSKDFHQLQLSDIIAGSTSKWLEYKWREEQNPYTKQLEDAGIQNLLHWKIWPSQEFTPQELGTEDIDFNQHVEFLASKIKMPHFPN
ncbi:DUF3800 domain-containing protein [Nitrospira sp.]|uniref:DUF3800 domain-containing protein n=1 Tax=Nitrospira sp. TaxID=70125 RepID=UPI003FCDB952